MTQVAIIGAGLVGMSAALALKKKTNTLLKIFDNNPKTQPKSKHPITLRYQHKKLLEQLELWDTLASKAVTIKKLSITQKDTFGHASLDAGTFGHEAIAYTIPYDVLFSELSKKTQEFTNYNSTILSLTRENDWQLCYQQNTQSKHEVAKRIVVADGIKAPISSKLGWQATYYGPKFYSIIYPIYTKYCPKSTAFQRFTSHYSYGIIPQQANDSNWLIITMNNKYYQDWLSLDTAQQHQRIKDDIQPICGEVEVGEPYASYPSQLHIRQHYSTPAALGLGSSQLSLPPIGAQGFNTTLQNINSFISQYQRSAWHIQEPLSWQAEYAKIVDNRCARVFNHAKRWMDLREQQCSIWQRLLQTSAWTWLGINGNIEHDIWQIGQGINPLEVS